MKNIYIALSLVLSCSVSCGEKKDAGVPINSTPDVVHSDIPAKANVPPSVKTKVPAAPAPVVGKKPAAVVVPTVKKVVKPSAPVASPVAPTKADVSTQTLTRADQGPVVKPGMIPTQADAVAAPKVTSQKSSSVAAPVNSSEADLSNIPIQLKCLFAAYPGEFKLEKDLRSLVFKDGTKMKFESKISDPSDSTLVPNPGLKSMFLWQYPKGEAAQGIWKSRTTDPGRNRQDEFFFKLYGNSDAAVRKNLGVFAWPLDHKRLSVNTKFGIREKFISIGNEVSQLVKQGTLANSDLKYFRDSDGTFLFRRVHCSAKQSQHSYGASIDLGTVAQSFYWKFMIGAKTNCSDSLAIADAIKLDRADSNRFDPEAHPVSNPHMPLAVVAIFEKNGFIWGGNWKHIDTMHFEYRPELLLSDKQCEDGFRTQLKTWRGL